MKKNIAIAVLSVALVVTLGFAFVQKQQSEESARQIKELHTALDSARQAAMLMRQMAAQQQMAMQSEMERVHALAELTRKKYEEAQKGNK